MEPIDKSDWGPGPWQDEPDEMKWRDFATGYDCYVVRHSSLGNFCGYVRVPIKNKLYRVPYQVLERRKDADIRVHGGITFSGPLGQIKDTKTKGWWFGFDCGHGSDISPGLVALLGSAVVGGLFRDAVYRNLSDCWQECTSLALQLSQFERDR